MRPLPWMVELVVYGLGLAGISAVVYGVSQVSVPAAWIVGGSAAVVEAYGVTRKFGRRRGG